MTWSDPAYRDVARMIGERTGLVFPASRHGEVEAALRELVPDPTDVEQVAGLFVGNGEAREALVARLTIGESYFFRDAAQFELISAKLLPELAALRSGVPLRLWSAGCASGEEPYSLAMVCEQLGLHNAHIVGTDISRTRLAYARAGAYRPWALRGVERSAVDRWFTHTGSRYVLAQAIRERVEFRYLNLAEDRFPSLTDGIWGMDLILCRNVLIYFDKPTIAHVATRLLESLSEEGWLLLGASDPAIGEMVDCEVTLTAAGLAYRRRRVGVGAWAGETLEAETAAATSTTEPVPLLPMEDREVAAAASPAAEALPGETAPEDLWNALERAYRARDYAAVDALGARMLSDGDADAGAWAILIRAFANRGCMAEAGRAAARALDRYRDSAELLYLHAVVLSESGQYGAASAELRRALYLDPSLAVVHVALADTRSRLGDRAGERRALRNAAALLEGLPAGAAVPASDGQRAARLARLVKARMALLEGAA